MEKLFGLIGEKLGHTYSPIINNKIMEEINMDGHYGVFQVKRERLKDVVPGIKALGYTGINVTIPYKTEIIKYLDYLSPEAEKIDAINVVYIDKGGLAAGYNTDYYGFGMMLENAEIKIKDENILILGTGGASKAVRQYLMDAGAKNIIFLTRNTAAAKVKFPQDETASYDDEDRIKICSTVINTTPLGMYPNIEATPFHKKYFAGLTQVVDLIYNPMDTLLIKQAKEAGLKSVSGLYMLIAQTVKSQEIWNETKIPETVIANIYDFLKKGIYIIRAVQPHKSFINDKKA